ncbi:MAG: PIN domain nuclease [Nostocaceae cyanobacterium]|nr:PIN domain nuclease [Nostocaceae cyanobacterium]
MTSYLLDTNIILLIEFWVVATRPSAVNGLGWTVEETEQAVQMLINQFQWLEEIPDIFRLWFSLVTTHKISGKRTHDLRIQAVMLAHNISHILTLNPKDFVEIEGITIIHPNSINS